MNTLLTAAGCACYCPMQVSVDQVKAKASVDLHATTPIDRNIYIAQYPGA